MKEYAAGQYGAFAYIFSKTVVPRDVAGSRDVKKRIKLSMSIGSISVLVANHQTSRSRNLEVSLEIPFNNIKRRDLVMSYVHERTTMPSQRYYG